MTVRTGDQGTVTLLPTNMTLVQSKDMTLFTITDYALVNMTHPRTGIQMVIRMKRKIMSEMMTTYFPSLLLMMITYATTFFKPFFFEAALSVNLTTMLVMTTIFISKMEGLPPTSDIKMIDIWLVLCQMVPFAEVVLLTAMEYNRKDDSREGDGGFFDQTSLEDACEEDKQETPCQNCWVPQLKTIGRYILTSLTNTHITLFPPSFFHSNTQNILSLCLFL